MSYALTYVADYMICTITIDTAIDEVEAETLADQILAEYVKNPADFHLDEIEEYIG